MGVGLLHGMAGTGHLFGVIPALALGVGEAVIYLAAYLVAAVLAMGGFAFLLGRMAAKGGPRLVRRLMYGSGTAALVVGGFWIVGSWPV